MTPPSDPEILTLAGDFPPATRDQWRTQVASVLTKAGRLPEGFDGAPEDLLDVTVAEGVSVAPLYTAQDAPPVAAPPGLAPFTRGSRVLGAGPDGWDIRAHHDDPDVALTAEAVLADLENGVTSLWLVLGDGAIPVDGLRTVLGEVLLDLAPIALDAGPHTDAAARALFALAAERKLPPEALTGTLGLDPLGRLAAADAGTDVATGLVLAGELAVRCRRERPGLRAMTVDATAYHGAGADAAQELACSLSAGVAYLRALTESGLAVPDALAQLEFRYAATADQFTTIATLRAARTLWSRVAARCGARGPAAAQRQHAVSSPTMITARDPWVNMLRGTLAAFAAGVGGAEAVTVLPFDTRLGRAEPFSRRIARNTQSLLVAESSLARVVDPAGGSWYVERLTDSLARRAWEVFTGIERAGGLHAVLRDGSLAERLATTWAARRHRIATRAEPITGVSEFPNVHEKLPTRRPDDRAPLAGLLPRVRPADAFEALRDRCDAHRARTGERPSVVLASLGGVASAAARVGFATNLFQAGGLDTTTVDVPAATDGPDGLSGLRAAFTGSPDRVACLCGSDRAYAEQAGPVAEALREAGATRVMLAGKPGTHDSAAITGHVHAGCDAVAALTDTLDGLGVR